MVYMVLILNIFLGVTQNFLGKEFSRKYGADKRALLGFNIIVMGIATISAFLLMMKKSNLCLEILIPLRDLYS